MTDFSSIGLRIPDILLPRPGIDLEKWATIACDQFTSQPEYWQEVRRVVGDCPSSLNLVLPEVCLGENGWEDRLRRIGAVMSDYLRAKILREEKGLVLVERVISGKSRFGLIAALDLNEYDFSTGSCSLIRPSEETVPQRLPPRIRIRANAALECPHTIVLIDDPERTVIEPFAAEIGEFRKLYDFDLMLGAGRLRGYLIGAGRRADRAAAALGRLAAADSFMIRYASSRTDSVLLYVVGDGNHSLAAAKAVWQEAKAAGASAGHPLRYALVEIENIHDPGLEFYPIHRVIYGVKEDWKSAASAYFGRSFSSESCTGLEQARAKVKDLQNSSRHCFAVVTSGGFELGLVQPPTERLCVGSVEGFLGVWLKLGRAEKVDYVHGSEAAAELGRRPGNAGFILPALGKDQFFTTVLKDGLLAKKSFSIGRASDKRFYMECRSLIESAS